MSNIWHNTIGFYTPDNHDNPIYHEHIKPNNQHCVYQIGNFVEFDVKLGLFVIVAITHIIHQNHIFITVQKYNDPKDFLV